MQDDPEDYIAASPPQFQDAVADAQTRERVKYELISWRLSQRLTQADVAARMHVGQPTVSDFEKSAGDVHLSTLQRYAGAVGVRLALSVSASYPRRALTARADRTT